MSRAIAPNTISQALCVLAGLALVLAACTSDDSIERRVELLQTVEATVPLPTAQATAAPNVEPMRPVEERIRVEINKSTEYFMVSGETTSAIFRSIASNGPKIGSDHALGSVLGQWDLYRVVSSCSVRSMTVTLDIVVTLPGRLETTQRDLRDRWGQFTRAIEKHEQQHVDIYLDAAEEMQRQMFALDGSCASADAVDRIFAEQTDLTERAQDEFDRDDERDIANRRLPMKSRIETNEARLDELNRQIESAEANLSSIKRQLDSAQGQLAYNRLVAEYNSLLVTRNALGDEFNRLRVLTAALIEDFNWAQ